jgi:hypothetical protein
MKPTPKNNTLKMSIVLFVAAFLMSLATPMMTQAQTPIQINNPLGSTSGTVGDIVDKILEFLLQVGVPIAVLMYVWAGFLFLTSGGNEKKVNTAKQAVIWTSVGLAVLIISNGLVEVVKSILVI